MEDQVKRWAAIGAALLFFVGGVTWIVRADDSHDQSDLNKSDLDVVKADLAEKVAERKVIKRACEVGQYDPNICYIRGFPHPENDLPAVGAHE